MLRISSFSPLKRLIEAEAGNLVLWVPVFFGAGIAIYFALPFEPPVWLGAAVAVLLAILAISARNKPVRIALVMSMLICAGFSAASARTAALDIRTLTHKTRPIVIEGVIDAVEPARGRARVVLVDASDVAGRTHIPSRIRVSIPDPNRILAPGQRLRMRAVLRPPPPPIMPGAFDFQRKAYFDALGAYGYAMGAAVIVAENDPAGPDSLSRAIGNARRAITARVHAIAPDDPAAAVAAALLTGHRGFIDDATLDAMRDAGIAHLLAISGLHIGLVAGLVFAAVRAAIALIPRLALRFDGKKVAAACAIPAAAGYAVLAGFTVPTERALLMTGLMLTGILIDRRVLSLRTVALAALLILTTAPESLVSPGFQMSFAAVTALIAAYGWARDRRRRAGSDPRKGTIRRTLRYFFGVSATTVIAGCATAPFAIYHFQHVSAFGAIANLGAVPLAALWVMPMGLLTLATMPLGLHGVFAAAMIEGTSLILAVARWAQGIPLAAGDPAAPPVWGLACIVVGGLLLALFRSHARWIGVPVLAAGLAAPLFVTPPDIIVDGQARVVAVRGASGTLMLSSKRSARFETAGWQRRGGEGDRPTSAWPQDPETKVAGLRCDARGCLLSRHGVKIGIATDTASLADDCRLSGFIVALVPLPRSCGPPLGRIDRFDLWRAGTHALWIEKDGTVRIESVNGVRGRRPWTDAPESVVSIRDKAL